LAFNSFFSYAGFTATFVVPDVDEESAGSCFRLIASAFMVGRTITSYAWGKAADVNGQKFVLVSSLGISYLFFLLFGINFSSCYFVDILAWYANGIIGAAKAILLGDCSWQQRLEAGGMGLGSRK
jgi:MFS family permease